MERPAGSASLWELAVRVGALEARDLEEARAQRRRRGGSLTRILVRTGALNPGLLGPLRELAQAGRLYCERCGWRRASQEGRARGLTCRCRTGAADSAPGSRRPVRRRRSPGVRSRRGRSPRRGPTRSGGLRGPEGLRSAKPIG